MDLSMNIHFSTSSSVKKINKNKNKTFKITITNDWKSYINSLVEFG